MCLLVVETVKFLKDLVLLFWSKGFSKGIPAIVFVSRFLLELVVYQFCPVFFGHHAFISLEVIKQLPIRALFGKGLSHFLLLESFPFKLCPFFRRQLHFLDFGSLLGFDPLELDSCTLVLHLWHREPQIQLLIEFLLNVVECKLDDCLPEGWVLEALVDSFWRPNNVVHLSRFAFLIAFLSHTTKR